MFFIYFFYLPAATGSLAVLSLCLAARGSVPGVTEQMCLQAAWRDDGRSSLKVTLDAGDLQPLPTHYSAMMPCFGLRRGIPSSDSRSDGTCPPSPNPYPTTPTIPTPTPTPHPPHTHTHTLLSPFCHSLPHTHPLLLNVAVKYVQLPI